MVPLGHFITFPGFSKQDISLRLLDNILSINAGIRESKYGHSLLQAEQPRHINKKVPLPIKVTEEDQVLGLAMLMVSLPYGYLLSDTIPIS